MSYRRSPGRFAYKYKSRDLSPGRESAWKSSPKSKAEKDSSNTISTGNSNILGGDEGNAVHNGSSNIYRRKSNNNNGGDHNVPPLSSSKKAHKRSSSHDDGGGSNTVGIYRNSGSTNSHLRSKSFESNTGSYFFPSSSNKNGNKGQQAAGAAFSAPIPPQSPSTQYPPYNHAATYLITPSNYSVSNGGGTGTGSASVRSDTMRSISMLNLLPPEMSTHSFPTELHRALSNKTTTISQLKTHLLARPQACQIRDSLGRLPLHCLSLNYDLIMRCLMSSSEKEELNQFIMDMVDVSPVAAVQLDSDGCLPFTYSIYAWIAATSSSCAANGGIGGGMRGRGSPSNKREVDENSSVASSHVAYRNHTEGAADVAPASLPFRGKFPAEDDASIEIPIDFDSSAHMMGNTSQQKSSGSKRSLFGKRISFRKSKKNGSGSTHQPLISENMPGSAVNNNNAANNAAAANLPHNFQKNRHNGNNSSNYYHNTSHINEGASIGTATISRMDSFEDMSAATGRRGNGLAQNMIDVDTLEYVFPTQVDLPYLTKWNIETLNRIYQKLLQENPIGTGMDSSERTSINFMAEEEMNHINVNGKLNGEDIALPSQRHAHSTGGNGALPTLPQLRDPSSFTTFNHNQQPQQNRSPTRRRKTSMDGSNSNGETPPSPTLITIQQSSTFGSERDVTNGPQIIGNSSSIFPNYQLSTVLVDSLASIPSLAKTILLLNSNQNEILSLEIIEQMYLSDFSTGKWVVNMLAHPIPQIQKCGVDYLEYISYLVSDCRNSASKKVPHVGSSSYLPVEEEKNKLYESIARLESFLVALLQITHPKELERASSTPILQHVINHKLRIVPSLLGLVLFDLFFHVLLVITFSLYSQFSLSDTTGTTGVDNASSMSTYYLSILSISYLFLRKVCHFGVLLKLSWGILIKHGMRVLDILDILSLILAVMSISILESKTFSEISTETPSTENKQLREFIAVTTFMIWLKLIGFLYVVNTNMKQFITRLFQVLKETQWLLLILLCSILCFAQMMTILNGGDANSCNDGDMICGTNNIYLQAYSILFGAFDVTDFTTSTTSETTQPLNTVIFLVFSFLCTICLLSSFIALTVQTFLRSSSENQQSNAGDTRLVYFTEIKVCHSLLRGQWSVVQYSSIILFISSLGVIILLSVESMRDTLIKYGNNDSLLIAGAVILFIFIWISIVAFLSHVTFYDLMVDEEDDKEQQDLYGDRQHMRRSSTSKAASFFRPFFKLIHKMIRIFSYPVMCTLHEIVGLSNNNEETSDSTHSIYKKQIPDNSNIIKSNTDTNKMVMIENRLIDLSDKNKVELMSQMRSMEDRLDKMMTDLHGFITLHHSTNNNSNESSAPSSRPSSNRKNRNRVEF